MGVVVTKFKIAKRFLLDRFVATASEIIRNKYFPPNYPVGATNFPTQSISYLVGATNYPTQPINYPIGATNYPMSLWQAVHFANETLTLHRWLVVQCFGSQSKLSLMQIDSIVGNAMTIKLLHV